MTVFVSRPGTKLLTLGLVTVLFVLQGCAHSRAEKELDTELAAGPNVKNAAQLSGEAAKAIAAEPNLTSVQKARLDALHKTVETQNKHLYEESLKLRSQLIKEVFAVKYDAEEVAVIKKRLEEVEKKRLSLLFSAVDQANVILGRQTGRNQRLMLDFFQWEQFR